MNSGKKRRKGDTAQLAAQLAPLEELDSQSAAILPGSGHEPGHPQNDPQFGAIIVDSDRSAVPQDIMEGGEEKTYLGMEPVVLIIIGIVLVFIAFIAWQISLMPPK